MNVEEQYDRILDIYADIDLYKHSILTGSNGSGKSLIGSQLSFRVKKELGLSFVCTSMAIRTGTFASMGALSGITRDLDWLPTSQNTITNLRRAVRMAEGRYLVIDEPEIGCAEETELAIAIWLNQELPQAGVTGSLIITHSRAIVQCLTYPSTFYNLDGLTKEEWITRTIIPADLGEIEKNELFFYVKQAKKK